MRVKSFIVAAAACAAAALPGLSAHAADVGISVQISQPGVYGRVDIGRFPQPQVVYAQPVIIGRPLPAAQPVYMWVPPGHRGNWRQHCGRYNACGVPVYFVQDRWYQDRVERHRHDDDGDMRRHDRYERRDDRGHRLGRYD